MGWLHLLFDVLPAFIAVGRFLACSDEEAATALREELDEKLPINFYSSFYAEIKGLHAIVSNWDWVQEPEERNLHKILDELESRFLKTQNLVLIPTLIGFCFNMLIQPQEQLGWTVFDRTEPFPKLQALQRKLRPTQDNLEDIELEQEKLEAQEKKYLYLLWDAVRISQTESDRRRLIRRLREGYLYLLDLSSGFADHHTTEIRISQYPSKDVRDLASSLYKILQKHWSCTCPDDNAHGRRKTQFSLTAHRRFETTPNCIRSQEEKEAKFDILFSTNSCFLEWQESEIHVNLSR